MRKYLAIFSILFLLMLPRPASSQAPEPFTDPCDQLPLRDWPKSRNVQIQNGICAFQDGSLGPKKLLKDFVLRFKISMDPHAKLMFSYGTSMNDEYEFTISPTEASLVNYIRFGNASNTVLDTLLAKAPLQITAGKWVEMEFGMQAHRQWLTVDGKKVIDRETARFNIVGIRGSNGVYLDDIQLTNTDLSENGGQPPDYPAGLAETWIVFRNDKYELALIHPDGTGKQVLVGPLAESFPVQGMFSPDGKTLLIDRGDGKQTLLSFYSLESLQFLGSEINLPRSPKLDWMPDGQHIIVLRDEKSTNVIFEKINIKTGQVVATFQVPAVIDEQTIYIRSITTLDCSPTADIVSFEVYADVAKENVQRAIIFDLISQQAHFLPGSKLSLWSPDGDTLLSTAGGLIDHPSLVFTELPANIVKQITNYRDYSWSPNGQFIHIGTDNSGNKQYSVFIADLEERKLITLPLLNFGSFAPDSLHFVFSDSGRLIVRTLFDATELQIAEGVDPIWQPAPGLYPSELVHETQPTTGPTQSPTPVPTSLATKRIDTPFPGDRQDNSNLQSVSKPEQNTYPVWPFILFALSILGLAASGVFAYSRYFRRCPSCNRSNKGFDQFCMYCGTPLAPSAWIRTALTMLALLACSGCLVVGGAAGLLIRPKQNLAVQVLPIAASEPTRLDTLQPKSTERQPSVSQAFSCGSLDLFQSDLLTVLQVSESAQTGISQYFGQSGKTPVTDKTAEANLAETQVAQYMELIGNACPISFVSISHDGNFILVSGSNMAVESGKGHWAALYNRHTLQPVWIQPIKIEPPPFDEVAWNPTSDMFAVSSKNIGDEEAIIVYETSTGLPISKIPASTRKGAYCSPMSGDEDQFRWLPDGKRLIRKIDNAVQVLDAATGNVLNEISFDDSAMGSPYAAPDDNRCFFVLTWAPDGSRFATMGASIREIDNQVYNGLKIWDAVSSKVIAEKKPGMRYPSSISFSPDGKKILVTGSSPMIIDTQTGQPLQDLNACPICQGASKIIWTSDSQRLLMYEDNNLGLFDLTTQSWKTITLSTYRGTPQEWLNGDGHVLMTGNGLPTVVNAMSDEEISLLEYFRSSP